MPTFGPVPKRSKAGQVKGTSTVTGKGKADVTDSSGNWLSGDMVSVFTVNGTENASIND